MGSPCNMSRYVSLSVLCVAASLSACVGPGGVITRTGTGNLDPTFGIDGWVTTDFAGSSDIGRAMVIGPDGRIVVAGEAGGSRRFGGFSLARYEADGSPDISFGKGGKAGISVGHAYAVALQADGKIVVAGEARPNALGRPVFALARFNTYGHTDTTFGDSGSVMTILDSAVFDGPRIRGLGIVGRFSAAARAVAIQPDGKIVTAGNTGIRDGEPNVIALTRHNVDGRLDPTFGVNGIVITIIGTKGSAAHAIALDPHGMIIVAGEAGGMFALARYTRDGKLDPTFGLNGTMTTDLGKGEDKIHAMVLQPDGRIVVAGESREYAGLGSDFALARYTPGGQLDHTFGVGGIVTTYIGGGRSTANAVALQADGKIVAAGVSTSYNIGTNDGYFALARYTRDGKLDPTFGVGGRVITSRPGIMGESAANALAIQPDGKIVAAGYGWLVRYSWNFALVRYLP